MPNFQRDFQRGDEVENIPIGTVGGVVYKVTDNDLIHFIDENGIRFKMRANGLKHSNYITPYERIEILRRFGV